MNNDEQAALDLAESDSDEFGVSSSACVTDTDGASVEASLGFENVEFVKCVRTFRDQSDGVLTVSSMDCRNFLAGACDGTAKLWSLDSEVPLRTYRGHRDAILSLAVVNGKSFLTGSADKTVKLWDVETGNCVKTYGGYDASVWCVVVAEKDAFVSVCGNGPAFLKSISSGKELSKFDLQGGFNCVSKGVNNVIITASGKGEVHLWKVDEPRSARLLIRHNDAIWFVGSLDERRIVTGSSDRIVKVLECESKRCLLTFEVDKGTSDLLVLGSEKLLSVCDDGAVKIWNLESGVVIGMLSGHQDAVRDVCALSDQRILTASNDETIRLWNLTPKL